jgi:hypothetical protein
LDLEFLSFSLALKGVPNLTIRTTLRLPSDQSKNPATFYNRIIS